MIFFLGNSENNCRLPSFSIENITAPLLVNQSPNVPGFCIICPKKSPDTEALTVNAKLAIGYPSTTCLF